MNIEQAKTALDKQFVCAINAKHIGSFRTHPLRVIQALKSIIGIDIQNPDEKLINWGKDYLEEFNSRDKSELMFQFGDLQETITLDSIECALRKGDRTLSMSHLEQLSRVSDGRPLLEFLLELSLQQNGSSFTFTWSAIRANQFLSNEYITALLILSVEAVLDDDFMAVGNKMFTNNSVSSFENLCQSMQIKSEDLIRKRMISPLLPDFDIILNLDNSSVDDVLNTDGMARKRILKYVSNQFEDDITPELILLLDCIRTALKATSKELHPNIINTGNHYLGAHINA